MLVLLKVAVLHIFFISELSWMACKAREGHNSDRYLHAAALYSYISMYCDYTTYSYLHILTSMCNLILS